MNMLIKKQTTILSQDREQPLIHLNKKKTNDNSCLFLKIAYNIFAYQELRNRE